MLGRSHGLGWFRRPRSGAGGAEAGERQVVVLKHEPLGDHFLESTRASIDVEESVAGLAMEVVRVLGRDARQLVPIAPVGY